MEPLRELSSQQALGKQLMDINQQNMAGDLRMPDSHL